jgi:hypothetical protein
MGEWLLFRGLEVFGLTPIPMILAILIAHAVVRNGRIARYILRTPIP